MTLAHALSMYLTLNFLIALAFCGLILFTMVLRWVQRSLSSAAELQLHYVALTLILVFTVVQPFLPGAEVFQPAVKLWSAQSLTTFAREFTSPDQGGYMTVPTLRGASSVEADRVSFIWIAMGVLISLIGGAIVLRDLRKLAEIKRTAFLVRKSGRAHVYVNDRILVPFSYWLPGQANVVLPCAMIANRGDYKMALAHEIQHHRQGDTKWVYVIGGLRLLCVFNPIVHLWSKWISEVQEFACDETLVDQNKVESQAYARCLIEVAQTAVSRKFVPVCATGLTFLVEGNILKRRIEKMFTGKQTRIGRSISCSFGVVLTCLMAGAAYAAKSLVQDRRVSMSQAQDMAAKARSQSGFPVVVNDLVLAQLNRYIGTPEGREFMRTSLQRMENYRSAVEGKIREYGLPSELMAVPIIESGYQNLQPTNNMGRGAGLWMFIVSTARTFGLRVDNKADERLNVELLTDAAMRYFLSNHLRFRDWQLAALAYNVGENRVQQAVESSGSRDAWVLIRKGYENDRDYLARLMAAILIMRNPESVQ